MTEPLYTRYLREEFDARHRLTNISFQYDDDFNFGYDVIDKQALQNPDQEALLWCNPDGAELRFTFADIKHWSDKTANFLASTGVKKGDYVMVILRRHYQFWFVACALEKLGAVMVPATFMLKEHDLSYRIQAADISTIIVTDIGSIADVVDTVEPDCPSLARKIIVNDSPREVCAVSSSRASSGAAACDSAGDSSSLSACDLAVDPSSVSSRLAWIDFNDGVSKASEALSRVETSVYDPMLMYFSSGTSGNPKMVLHDSRYALAHLCTAKHWHNVVPGKLHFTIADTGWGKAVWGKYFGQWMMGADVFVYDFDRFNPAEILSCIEKYHIATLCCPPTMYRMMMEEDFDAYDLSSLVYSTTAGEALNPDLFDFWKNKTGLTIYEGFGQTETPLTIANITGSTPRPGSMGKPMPLYHVAVLRDDNSVCAVGETGEICIDVSDDAPGIMMEYFRNPEKTALAIHDGWYHTGDTAWVDEDGYYWYVGRNDDVIKSSGYRIGPFEIESVLLEHDAVCECAITGVPDEVRGMAVKATIVLKDGYVASQDLTKELQQWVKKRTAPYKYPRIVEYVDSLPKTVNGKIKRADIRNAQN